MKGWGDNAIFLKSSVDLFSSPLGGGARIELGEWNFEKKVHYGPTSDSLEVAYLYQEVQHFSCFEIIFVDTILYAES